MVVFGLIVVLRRPADPPPTAYSDAARAAFVDACAPGDGRSRSVCTCVYDELARAVPFDRFVALNADAAARVAVGSSSTAGSPPSVGSPAPATTPGAATAGASAPAGPVAMRPALPSDVDAIVAACVARQPSGAAPSTVGPTTVPASTTSVRPTGPTRTITLSGGAG